MGKRSNFKRLERDHYQTPFSAAAKLFPYLNKSERFCEPCAGNGSLVDHLESQGHVCAAAWDIEPQAPGIEQRDALQYLIDNISCFITNPPWAREILHPLISHLAIQHPTWLLIDADWMHTKQAVPYLDHCTAIISIGRVKWITDSKFVGKDNCCWYRFAAERTSTPIFIGHRDLRGVFT